MRAEALERVRATLPVGEGAAAWPIEAREALEQLASVFDAVLEEVADAPEQALRDETVVAFGEAAHEAARLYAGWTRRRFATASSLKELLAAQPAVVVTTPDLLEADVLEALYAPTRRGPAPGLVWGRTPDELRRNAMLRAAAAHLEVAPDGDLGLVDQSAPFGVERRGPMTIAGRRATRGQLRAFLGNRRGLLGVMGHSDGVDAAVSEDLVLCSRRCEHPLADRTRAPRCVTTGLCHRRDNKPVDQALADGDLVAVDELRSPIMILASCFGLMPNGAVMDSAWGLADQLVGSTGVGAVISSWEVAYVIPPLVEGLVRDLEAGKTIGEATARLNRSAAAIDKRFRMCIIGDPSLRLPGNPAARTFDLVPPIHMPPPAEVEAEVREDLAGVAALRVFLGTSQRRAPNTPTSQRRALHRVSAALAKHELSLLLALDPRYAEGSTGADVRRAVIDYMIDRGPVVYPFWEKAARVETLDERRVCVSCGNPHNVRTSYVGRFFVDVVPPRRLSFCPGCVFVEDVPLGLEVEFGWRSGVGFTLGGALPERDWDAVLILREQDQATKHWHRWPARAGGGPAKTFIPPGELPPGPVESSLVLVTGLDLAVLSHRAMLR